jgi:hypothetical protein
MSRLNNRLCVLAAALAVATALMAQAQVPARERCSALITTVHLTGYHPKGPFFIATEAEGGTFKVERGGDNCVDGEWTDVYFSLRAVTTSEGDLSPESGRVRLYAPTDGTEPGGDEREIDIDVVGDIDGVEKAIVRLDRDEHSGQDDPVYYNRAAPFYVVDSEAPASVVMGEPTMHINEGLTARIPVFRTGPISGDRTVGFSVVPGTATPGADYEEPSSSSVTFSGGSRVEVISVRVLGDDFKEGDENFTVVLDGEGVGAPAETTITIGDLTANDLRPTGKLHHPRQNYTYPRNYPWLNEIHIFTKSADENEFRVNKAQLALRKRWKGGDCAWWHGDGFKRGGCNKVRWFGKGIKNPSRNYFKYNLKKKPSLSVGESKVKDYKIWSRWFDDEGRMSILKKGRNMNRFEVMKPCEGNPYTFKKCKPNRP